MNFIGDAPLVAHNAMFDLGFLNAELERVRYPSVRRDRLVDTLMLARRKYPGGSNRLDDLCGRFGIDLSRRTKHSALLDAELLAEVLSGAYRCPPGSAGSRGCQRVTDRSQDGRGAQAAGAFGATPVRCDPPPIGRSLRNLAKPQSGTTIWPPRHNSCGVSLIGLQTATKLFHVKHTWVAYANAAIDSYLTTLKRYALTLFWAGKTDRKRLSVR